MIERTQSQAVQSIEEMPKVELHLHLEGCIPLALIEQLSKEQDVSPPKPLAQLYRVRSLSEFLQTLDWVCGLFTQPQQLNALAHTFADYAEQQNLTYAELIVNPSHWHLDYADLFEPLTQAFDDIQQTRGLDFRLLPSIGRHQSAPQAEALASWCTTFAHPRVIGLSIDGDERVSGSHCERFAGAFQHAGAHGLGLTAHAGESSDAQGVFDALDILGAQRIDHGVKSVQSAELIQRLVEQSITLNVCVSSNCALVYDKVSDHPLPALRQAGVGCTLNTDDPVVLDTDLCRELAFVGRSFGWGLTDLVAMQQQAIDAAFCDAQTKRGLTRKLHNFVGKENE
ncbi:MAG: adenosine deaminase [Pseudomonadota bacterium]